MLGRTPWAKAPGAAPRQCVAGAQLPGPGIRHACPASRSCFGPAGRSLVSPLVGARVHRANLCRTAGSPGDSSPISTRLSDSQSGPVSEGGSAATNGATNGAIPSSSLQPSASSSNAAPVPPSDAGGIPQRWKVTIMMAIAFVLCNMDKVNMSVAVIPMAHELGWSATERGFVSSAFFWGYALTQVPAGFISTKIGGTKVLMAGVALWSLGTLIAPPAAKMSLWMLCATRVLVGLGEGFAPSAATAVLAKQVPSGERARAVSTVFGGLDVGSAVGLLLCGPLIRMYGWPSVFYLFAILGLVWCALWPLVKPETIDPLTAAQEKAQAEQDAAKDAAAGKYAPPPSGKMPWLKFMTSKAVWAIITAHFCFNWGYYTLLAWLPSYFELALGMQVDKSSFLTLIPYVAMTCMTPFVGPIADGMVKKGMSLTSVRKLAQGIAFVGPAACMIACAVLTPTSPAAAAIGPLMFTIVGLLSLSFALGAWSRAGLYCNHQDLSPKYASALLGITNTFGALPGILGVASAGYLLDVTNNWALALFYPTAACQLFGAVVYTALCSAERFNFDAA